MSLGRGCRCLAFTVQRCYLLCNFYFIIVSGFDTIKQRRKKSSTATEYKGRSLCFAASFSHALQRFSEWDCNPPETANFRPDSFPSDHSDDIENTLAKLPSSPSEGLSRPSRRVRLQFGRKSNQISPEVSDEKYIRGIAFQSRRPLRVVRPHFGRSQHAE